MLDIAAIRHRAIQTWAIYNLPMLFACLGTALGILEILSHGELLQSGLFGSCAPTLILAAGLSFIGSVILELCIQHNHPPARTRIPLNIALFIIMLGVAFYFLFENTGPGALNVLFLEGALFLLLIGLPFFLYPKNDEKFWYYNDALCTGLMFSILSNVTIAAGLGAIILSINYLFRVEISWEAYTAIMVGISGVGIPLLWLSAIPLRMSKNAPIKHSENIKQNISVWIFMPLVLIYGIILHAYFAKIIITQELPRGFLSVLILGFAGAALLGYLISWIFRKEVIWLAKIQRWLPYVLMAPLVFLCIAIGHRIHDYGLTTNRVLLCLLALWLANAIVFVWQSQRQDGALAKLPLSLAVILLIAAFIPEIRGVDRAPLQEEASAPQETDLSYYWVYLVNKSANLPQAANAIAPAGHQCILPNLPVDRQSFTCNGHQYNTGWLGDKQTFVIADSDGKPLAWATTKDAVQPLLDVVKHAEPQAELPLPEDTSITFKSNGNGKAKLVVKKLGFEIDHRVFKLQEVEGYLLFTPPR